MFKNLYFGLYYCQLNMIKYLIGCLISLALASGYACLVGQNSNIILGMPSFYMLVIGIHLMQFIAFVPAKIFNTQKFYDLTGSITFILSIAFSLWIAPSVSHKQLISALMVLVWTGRLGTFLFSRILQVGEDSRFRIIKKHGLRFFMAWCLQGLWVTITAGTVFSYLTAKASNGNNHESISLYQYIGLAIWFLGFLTESFADFQKNKFNSHPLNKGKFIHSGLWKYSRHPNYCGEVLVWLGVAVFVFRSLEGWQRFSLISPLFVYLLLTKVSGVPMLQAKANKKWGGQP